MRSIDPAEADLRDLDRMVGAGKFDGSKWLAALRNRAEMVYDAPKWPCFLKLSFTGFA